MNDEVCKPRWYVRFGIECYTVIRVLTHNLFPMEVIHMSNHVKYCFRWLETADAEFDLIFMDPPTFSNSKKMRDTLDVQRDHPRLVELAMARLAPGGTLVFSNNQRRFKLDEALSEHYAVEDITGRSFDPDFQRRTNLHHVFLLRHKAS